MRDLDTAQDVLLSAVPKGEEPVAYLSFNRNGYSTYCRVFREYWEWVAKRNAERYQNTVQHGKNYDAKNMLHVFRLLQIRCGAFEYEALVAEAEAPVTRVDAAFAASDLPEAPDRAAAEQRLREVRRAFYAAAQG